jgi:UDPglucose 6-dehydrogenase
MQKMKRVGIIGVGTVGSAIYRYFREKKKAVPILYDPPKNLGSVDEINSAEIIFIAVPTPANRKSKGYDLNALKSAIQILRPPKIILIKSTIFPGTTERFQKKYPKHTILFSPEFLRTKSAYKDFCYPDRQIIGYVNAKGKKTASAIMKLLPKAPFQAIMPAAEAEMIKLATNAFLATKVIFANQIYDFCRVFSIDYSLVKRGLAGDPRIGSSHLGIFDGGYRGLMRSCLPKDLDGLIWGSRKTGLRLKLFEVVRKINIDLLVGSKSFLS